MKKYSIFTLILLAIASSAMSQDIKKTASINKPFNISLTAGFAAPVGDFSTTKGNEPGFAKVGYNFNLNFGYNINSRLGIASTAFYAYYKLNNKAINDLIGSGGPTSSSVTSDHWKYHGIVAGPMTTFELAENVYLDLKFMAGFANVNFPVFKASGESSPEKWKAAYAMKMGGNVRYNLNDKFCFYSSLDYFYTRPTWKFTESVDGETIKSNISQRLESVNINVGIGYNF